MTVSAKLIFAGRPPRSLPQFADLIARHLRDGDISEATLQEASLSALSYETEGLAITLGIVVTSHEAVLTLSLEMPTQTIGLTRLAALCFHLARALEVEAVVWDRTDLRIPGADFVAGLADCFEPTHRVSSIVMPRRVRPGMSAVPRPVQKMAVRQTDKRYDAHIALYEAHLREVLTAPMPQDDALGSGFGARLRALAGQATGVLRRGSAQAAT